MAKPLVSAGAKAKLAGLVHSVVASSCKDALSAGNTLVVVIKLSESTAGVVSLIGVVDTGEAGADPMSEKSSNMFHHFCSLGWC